MKKYPIYLYALPFAILLVVIVFIYGSNDMSKTGKNTLPRGNSSSKGKGETSESQNGGETTSEKQFQNRIPVYPNSTKAKLQENADVAEASFYVTTDPIEKVKEWYLKSLGGTEKVNLIDIFNREGLRVITMYLPDPPKDLVEIKERYKGAKDILITITNLEFYTRNQPRPYEPSKKETDSTEKKGDEKGNT
jgi:hypothetical protein